MHRKMDTVKLVHFGETEREGERGRGGEGERERGTGGERGRGRERESRKLVRAEHVS